MRVRFVGGALSVLLVVCFITNNPIVRVQAYYSEADGFDYDQGLISGDPNSQVEYNNLQNANKIKENTQIVDPLLPSSSSSTATPTPTSEISSALDKNKSNDINIREAGKIETSSAKDVTTTVEKRDKIAEKEPLLGIPQETYDQAYQDRSSDAISAPLNQPSDLLRLNARAGASAFEQAGNSNQGTQQTTDEKAPQLSESSARGFGSNLFNAAKTTDPNQQPFNGSPQPPAVSHEDLPTIIENNQQVDLTKQGAADSNNKLQPNTYSNSSTGVPSSSARTFDSWTNCVGSTSNKYGTCKNDVECEKHKGRADGSCMGGLGVCCVMALSCNDKSIENNTFFANSDFPEPSWEARQCQVELTKKSSSVIQIMIEFDEFELAPPNNEGECITDVFQVRLASNKPSPYSLLRICGHNTGQHLYLDVSQIDEPLLLSIATSGGGFPRRWSIRIVQMDYKNHLLAPPGCLQYYTDTVGHFRSFNLGKNLKNLYYAICFRIDNGYSGIRFTSNFFGMNGPLCRKRIGKQLALGGQAAHPHHLVIPPPGSAIPPPGPYQQLLQVGASPQQPQQQYQQPVQSNYQQASSIGPKYKRSAPAPPAPPGNPSGQNTPPNQANTQSASRTISHIPGFGLFGSKADKEAKLDSKEFEKHEHLQKFHPYPPQPYLGYSQSPYYPPTYGPPPQIIYGGEPGKNGLGGEKEHELLKHKPEHFGWKGEGEIKFSEGIEGGYGQYPHPGAYLNPYGSSGYHHKEIGKFGEKYEHLHEKHEKNHHHGKDDKASSWWPSFGFGKDKDGKKDKEKFFMHHEALFPLVRMPEMPHCDPRYCGANDVITFPPSGDSIAEMCGNSFNRGRGPKIISGSPLVVYVSNRGAQRGSGFDMNYEQVFYIPKPY